jgi:hypothetical protein
LITIGGLAVVLNLYQATTSEFIATSAAT